MGFAPEHLNDEGSWANNKDWIGPSILCDQLSLGANVVSRARLAKYSHQECCSLHCLSKAHVVAQYAPLVLAIMVKEELDPLQLVATEVLGNVRGHLCMRIAAEDEGLLLATAFWVVQARPPLITGPHRFDILHVLLLAVALLLGPLCLPSPCLCPSFTAPPDLLL